MNEVLCLMRLTIFTEWVDDLHDWGHALGENNGYFTVTALLAERIEISFGRKFVQESPWEKKYKVLAIGERVANLHSHPGLSIQRDDFRVQKNVAVINNEITQVFDLQIFLGQFHFSLNN